MAARSLLYVLLIWLLLLGAGILDRLLENAIVSPESGDYGAHIFSATILILFVLIVIYIFIHNIEIRHYRNSDLFFIGVLWASMTILYEFVYRHYFGLIPWNEIFEDYDFATARLRSFVVLSELFAPVVFGVRRRRRVRRSVYGSDRYR